MLDLVLAILHHILIFAIFGILFAEFMALRSGMNPATPARIASIDHWYGILAGAIKRSGVQRPLALLLLLFGLMAGLARAQATSPLELVVLGSGGPGATGRASSSYLVLVDGVARILVDAGSGSFTRLGESQIALANADIVLLTHLHIDHVGELPGIFKARALSTSEPIVFNVWGPDGSQGARQAAYFPSTRRFLDLLFGAQGAFAYLKDFSAPITIRAHDIAARGVANPMPRVIDQEHAFVITAAAGHHGDAPAVIYRIDHAGKSITFSGDVDANGLRGVREIAKETDLLVFNCVVLDPPDSAPILYTLHTPPHAIGEVAKQAGVHQLLLSHLSPATIEKHTAVLESIRRNYTGPIAAAEDGMRVQP